jgi:hypothetical protein
MVVLCVHGYELLGPVKVRNLIGVINEYELCNMTLVIQLQLD